jgi:hypothetical protein
MAPISQLDTTLSNSNSNLELLSQVGIGDHNELDACLGVRGCLYSPEGVPRHHTIQPTLIYDQDVGF